MPFMSRGRENSHRQNDAVLSLLPAMNSTLVMREGKSLCIYIVLFQLACVPLRKSRGPFGGRKFPPDFGGANFFAPWTTRKADFAADLKFFNSSSIYRGKFINVAQREGGARSTHSVTSVYDRNIGGTNLVKILFWPGGQAGTRRKHRQGYLCSWCTH